ncbi:Ankyrin [Methylobacterium sp. 4-46]|uniref:ethylbenzene dehydrogenase-related protein n=1 Tax=unclassified Methylobacterium TaxID=2615210 RepID=UPI000152C81F|nr:MULTISPECIES: ethylbenzene dehydrogenase-related protein [Methylobacterium]ACA17113.1 Ankyrin [Methylobacterium sp. 4-46]WFT82798.1 ethylbenzene dehydrogenase-related protein [Methylobacterium nodulans]
MNEMVSKDRLAGAQPQSTDGLRPRLQPRGSGLPTSDVGTVILHWTSAVAMTASLVTGLRISADALDAVVARWLSPILPQGEVWTVHIYAGLLLFGVSVAYVAYMARSGLANRVALRKARALKLAQNAQLRWMGANVLLHWLLFGLVIVLTATGILLYLGHGGLVVTIHEAAAYGTLAYTLLHLVGHFGYGGWRQWLRIFRPAALAPNPAQRSRRPMLVAGLVTVPAVAAAVGLDLVDRDTLTVETVAQAPTLDGVLDDAAWRAARPVRVRTQQGANLGGTGESTVEIRAVQDGTRIYFAFRWQDPTRSIARVPMIKEADGWHVHASRAGEADVVDFYEDKFAAIFSHSDGFGAGGVTHLGPRPLPDKPSSLNQRGLHYTTDGSYVDMWQWKSSRGGLLGHVDDQYMGPPREPTPDEARKRARYQGGYWNDPGSTIYSYNFPFEGPGGYAGPVKPKRLPVDPAATMAALGHFDLKNPDTHQDEGARWWLTGADSKPYTEEDDARIPVGTVIPGVLNTGTYEGDRADLSGGAKWKDGYWTLEVSRALRTGSRYDVDFVPGEPLYLWVAVFDHTQTRHTRHVRPVRVVLR